jgi:hypothetical protein
VGQTARPPFFFLSYAHDEDREENARIGRFCDRLIHDVRMFSGDRTATGFCDTRLRIGNRWSPALVDHLSTAQVFVAVLSPMYFQSDACGREWAVFEERMAAGRRADESESRVIPLLWVPMEVPAVARQYQYRDRTLGAAYATRRLRALLRNEGDPEYSTFIETLARRIVDLNDGSLLPPARRRPRFSELSPAFPAPPVDDQRAESEPPDTAAKPATVRQRDAMPRLNPAHVKKDDAR